MSSDGVIMGLYYCKKCKQYRQGWRPGKPISGRADYIELTCEHQIPIEDIEKLRYRRLTMEVVE